MSRGHSARTAALNTVRIRGPKTIIRLDGKQSGEGAMTSRRFSPASMPSNLRNDVGKPHPRPLSYKSPSGGEFVLVLSEAVLLLVLDVFRLFAFALKVGKPEYKYETDSNLPPHPRPLSPNKVVDWGSRKSMVGVGFDLSKIAHQKAQARHSFHPPPPTDL